MLIVDEALWRQLSPLLDRALDLPVVDVAGLSPINPLSHYTR